MDKEARSEKLVLGAMMAALSAVLFVVFRVPVVFMCSVFPVAYVGLRSGLRAAWMAALVASCAIAAMLGPIAGLDYALPFGMMGPLMAWLLRGPAPGIRRLLFVAVANGAAMLVKISIVLWALGKRGTIGVLIEKVLQWNAMAVGALLAPLQAGVSPESGAGKLLAWLGWAWGSEFHTALARSLMEAPVGLAIVVSLSDLFMALMMAVLFFRKLNVQVPDAPRPADFRVGPWAIALLGVSHLLVLSRLQGAAPVWAWVGANVLITVAVAHYTLALGAVQRMLERRYQDRGHAFAVLWVLGMPIYPLVVIAGMFLNLAQSTRYTAR